MLQIECRRTALTMMRSCSCEIIQYKDDVSQMNRWEHALKGLFTGFTWVSTEPSQAIRFNWSDFFRPLRPLKSILWCQGSVQSLLELYCWTILDWNVTLLNRPWGGFVERGKNPMSLRKFDNLFLKRYKANKKTVVASDRWTNTCIEERGEMI